MKRARGFVLATATLIALLASACTPANSADHDAAPDVNLPGVDTHDLLPRERREYATYVREMLAPCPSVAVPIGQCLSEKRDCAACLPAAKAILRGVRDGMTREQIEKLYKDRFDPSAIHAIEVGASPTKGPANAKVTLVEFADFECPFCQKIAPQLDASWEKHKGEVLFVYKFLPLAMHPHGEIAARAAIAAQKQDKFWPMHDLLFQNQRALERQDLDKYAQSLGLDMTRFAADFDSEETSKRIAADRALADRLQVRGTPSIYVGGHEFDGHGTVDAWLEEALEQALAP